MQQAQNSSAAAYTIFLLILLNDNLWAALMKFLFILILQ